MKSFLGAALIAAAILPAAANASVTSAASSKQNVFTSVSHTFIENADGSETQITVYTSYYIFGVR
jgi:opacity protein-like surface antigen